MFLGDTISEGFGKAISLSIGKEVCWNQELGVEFVNITLEKRKKHQEAVQQREIEIKQNLTAITETIDNLIGFAVHQCESLIIDEIEPEKIVSVRKRKSTRKIYSRTESIIGQQNVESSQKGRSGFNANSEKEKKTDQNSSGYRTKGIKILNSSNRTSYSNQTKAVQCTIEKRNLPGSLINVSVDREVDYNPLNHFIHFDLIKDILTAVFCHMSFTDLGDKNLFEIAEDIFNKCKNPQFNFGVLIHEYLNNDEFLDLVKHSSKFLMKSPIKIVEKCIDYNTVLCEQ